VSRVYKKVKGKNPKGLEEGRGLGGELEKKAYKWKRGGKNFNRQIHIQRVGSGAPGGIEGRGNGNIPYYILLGGIRKGGDTHFLQ